MAALQEGSSSPELDAPAVDLHSSTEDLLSDSALHGSQFYRDLGLLSPPAPEAAVQPERATPAVSAAHLLEERPGALSSLSVDIAFSNPVPCLLRYAEADCSFLNKGQGSSCAAVPGGGTSTSEGPAEADKELQEAKDSFPTLVRSMSTSRRHSWESSLSPVDCKRRYSRGSSSVCYRGTGMLCEAAAVTALSSSCCWVLPIAPHWQHLPKQLMLGGSGGADARAARGFHVSRWLQRWILQLDAELWLGAVCRSGLTAVLCCCHLAAPGCRSCTSVPSWHLLISRVTGVRCRPARTIFISPPYKAP